MHLLRWAGVALLSSSPPTTLRPIVASLSGPAEQQLAALTVAQLKDRLRTASLPVSGRKAELIERLLLAGKAPPAPPTTDAAIAIEFCKQ